MLISVAAGTPFGGRGNQHKLTLAQRAKATLRYVRFSSGVRVGRLELAPRLTRQQQRELKFWIRRMPPAFQARLPRLKLAVADQLNRVRTNVFINENPLSSRSGTPWHTHAASFIPERYIVLDAGLFRRRVELGRILYHELCHFLWPRLGNPKRERFGALLGGEIRQGIAGELGYSSQGRKAHLPTGKTGKIQKAPLSRQWREYVCESFCDTGSFVLLDRERRKRHSEYTLGKSARDRRCRQWAQIVFGQSEAWRGRAVAPHLCRAEKP